MKVTIYSKANPCEHKVFIGVDEIRKNGGYFELFIHNNNKIMIEERLWFMMIQ